MLILRNARLPTLLFMYIIGDVEFFGFFVCLFAINVFVFAINFKVIEK